MMIWLFVFRVWFFVGFIVILLCMLFRMVIGIFMMVLLFCWVCRMDFFCF